MIQPLFANRRIRVKSNICMMIKRKLKGAGKITAIKNTEVSPHDVLGHYKMAVGFTKINLSRELSVSPGDVKQYLKKNIGQTVFKGELLAFKKGLFGKSEIVASTDGIFDSLDENTGIAGFRLIPKDIELTSGVFGVVQSVDVTKGEVTIKSMMSEVYGMYGTGSEKEGFINVLSGPGDLVSENAINDAHRGQILVAGSLALEATIKKALSCSVSGIISGGMNLSDYLSMAISLNPLKRVGTDIGIPVIASEGFGVLPIGEDIYDLLRRYSGKFAIIQGNLGRILLPSDDPNSILSCRKVELPPNEALGVRPELSIEEIKEGIKVRLITPPFMGAQGEVISIDGSPTKLASGISTYLVTLATKTKKIKVPFSNLEII